MVAKLRLILLIPVLLFLQACEDGPKEPDLKIDACAHCGMKISQIAFMAQTQNAMGKPYFFDSIECLAAYSLEEEHSLDLEKTWVTKFGMHPEWISITQAFFLQNQDLKSPMSLNLAAFSSEKDLNDFKNLYGGKAMSWKEVQAFVTSSWNL